MAFFCEEFLVDFMTVFNDCERVTPLMINDILYNNGNGEKISGWVIRARVGFMRRQNLPVP